MDQPEPTPGKDPETGQFLPGHKVTTAFKPQFVEQAKMLCERFGAIDRDLADFFGVCVRTIHRWKHDFPEFNEALILGKEAADERVVRSLYHRAIGYSFDSEKVFCDKGHIVRTPTVEHVPPSDQAAIFWLKNRRKDEWRDSSQIDHSSSDGSMSPQAPVYNITEK